MSQTATIQTTTVTIKALVIGRRQFTQSTFKQLPIARRYLEVWEPWGIVRYKPSDSGAHLWLVYHVEGKLYRFPLDPERTYVRPPTDYSELTRQTNDELRRATSSLKSTYERYPADQNQASYTTDKNLKPEIYEQQRARAVIEASSQIANAKNKLAEAEALSKAEVERYDKQKAAEDARLALHRKLIETVDQLFIAV